jgi:hypothetical protein
MIAEPSRSSQTFAAASCCPLSGRARCTAGRKLVLDPCSASSDSAHARSAVTARRRARTRPSDAIADMNCVPLTSERPSLLTKPNRLEADRPQRVRPREELAAHGRLALADERECEMSERREVSAGAHRTPRRHAW